MDAHMLMMALVHKFAVYTAGILQAAIFVTAQSTSFNDGIRLPIVLFAVFIGIILLMFCCGRFVCGKHKAWITDPNNPTGLAVVSTTQTSSTANTQQMMPGPSAFHYPIRQQAPIQPATSPNHSQRMTQLSNCFTTTASKWPKSSKSATSYTCTNNPPDYSHEFSESATSYTCTNNPPDYSHEFSESATSYTCTNNPPDYWCHSAESNDIFCD